MISELLKAIQAAAEPFAERAAEKYVSDMEDVAQKGSLLHLENLEGCNKKDLIDDVAEGGDLLLDLLSRGEDLDNYGTILNRVFEKALKNREGRISKALATINARYKKMEQEEKLKSLGDDGLRLKLLKLAKQWEKTPGNKKEAAIELRKVL